MVEAAGAGIDAPSFTPLIETASMCHARLTTRYSLADMAAKLWLDFSTQLRVERQEIPWRVVRGFPNTSSKTLHMSITSPAASSIQRLELPSRCSPVHWRGSVHRHTRCLAVTPSGRRARASKLRSARAASSNICPTALIPYGGSRYQQTTRIRMARGASLIWWEIVSPGREALAGAVPLPIDSPSRLEIFSGNEPILEEILDVEPAHHTPDSAARLGSFPPTCAVAAVQADAARSSRNGDLRPERHRVPG